MTINLIVTCVAQKKASKYESILDAKIESGTLEEVFHQWTKGLTESKLSPVAARQLYSGILWNKYLDVWGAINGKHDSAKLWVISAGYGLVSGDQLLKPYNITFQDAKFDTPSLFSKVKHTGEPDFKKKTVKKWWKLLCRTNLSREVNSISELIKKSNNDDKFIIVAGKDYIEAISEDLLEGIKYLTSDDNLIVISNSSGDKFLKIFYPHWLFADKKFAKIANTNSTSINGSIAKELIVEMFKQPDGTEWWSIQNFNNFLQNLADSLCEVKHIDREKSNDEVIIDYIFKSLNVLKESPTKLHRKFRDSGLACEYKRFQSLYKTVLLELEESSKKSQTLSPVSYTKRDSEIMFFLPDWDDRVDPTYDFKNEKTEPFRDPYEHDRYHYEIYGHLNCDGILVSKSVLEDNSSKKEKAQKLGIHSYLRLPSEVPVFGDCGAFSYLMDENPPYETEEILQFYENLGFNYGVSIDHLIIPVVYTKERYKLLSGEVLVDIDLAELNRLKNESDVSIITDKRLLQQRKLFDGVTIFKETFIDESERERRYKLTLKNGLEFIGKYKSGVYNFIPVGAVQGWNPESYAAMAFEYEKAGYEYLAIGGLVRSKTSDILLVLEELQRVLSKSTKIHVFGVARPDAIKPFIERGVTSVDNAGVLRQAWLSSTDNYYAPGFSNYTAIRIPLADSKRIIEMLAKKNISVDDAIKLERKALEILWKYHAGNETFANTIKTIIQYSTMMDVPESIYKRYQKTLMDKPWQICPCKICKETGIDVIIFRGNNRNRRRGFHNTWVYFEWLKETKDI